MRKRSNERIPTLKEVARLAGVSVATVSRVLNGKGARPEVETRVLAAAKELRYKPNPGARFMKGKRAETIGLLLPMISHPFFGALAEGALEEAGKNDQVVVIASSRGNRELEKQKLEQFSRSFLDGMIYFPVEKGETFPEIEHFRNIPLVVAGRRAIFPNKPHVYSDNLKGGYLATKYLLRLGRERIAFFAGFWTPPCTHKNIREASEGPGSGAFSSLDRFRGYLKALEEASLDFDTDLVTVCGYDFKSGIEAAKELTARMVNVDALICPNDLVAAGAIQFLEQQGMNIPEDISVAGYDDDPIAVMTTPTLTTIRQQTTRIGIESVGLINSLIRGKAVEDVVVDVDLIIRNSTSHTRKDSLS